ncbi:MAG: MotA/TolQ/ExbB proton channel family protein [Bacteroidales bacterium]
MSSQTKKGSSSYGALFNVIAIVLAGVASWFIFDKVMGNPANFVAGNRAGEVLNGSYLGIIYKGGFIVPVLITCILVLLTFSIERAITISKAKGRGRLNVFVKNIQLSINADEIEASQEACDKQKGSLANVVKAGLKRYRELQADPALENDQKVVALQKEIEEATALELPMLSKNLVIISTIASIAVLIGLIGTVLGMIRAFKAMAQAGAPDALALATGISEALINTAFGITGSTIAIVVYNYFSTTIDGLTYKIDEAGFSLVQTFSASLKK